MPPSSPMRNGHTMGKGPRNPKECRNSIQRTKIVCDTNYNNNYNKFASSSHNNTNTNNINHNNNHNHNHNHNNSNNNNHIKHINRLPVHDERANFFSLLKQNSTIIVTGETGSGKTTQIPQWCMDYCAKMKHNEPIKCVACTQPRRIAAMSVAARVAKERSITLGQEVGYSVRFESCSSSNTKLKYLTDGMLLREAMLDSTLSSYGIIILDEAHERTLQTEILFGVIKRALKARNTSAPITNTTSAINTVTAASCSITTSNDLPPLKVVVMSATLNTKIFKRFLNAPVLEIPGRQHPVQELYTELPQSDLLTSTLTTVFQIHRTSGKGDILVFCSGQDEILSLIILCKRTLKHAPAHLQNLLPLPLYASLPAAKQMRVFDQPSPIVNRSSNMQSASKTPNSHTDSTTSQNGTRQTKNVVFNSPTPSSASLSSSSSRASVSNQTTTANFTRRVIFATNVAETSVTIPGIKFVIDTGKVKCRYYCPKTGLESLKVTNISKAQARQRSGRAGRLGPGFCYRLFTYEEFDKMNSHQLPEIKRCNLNSVLLQLISMGVDNIGAFEFLERPEEARLKTGLQSLMALKAIKLRKANVPNGKQPNGISNTDDSVSSRPENCNQSATTSTGNAKKIEILNDDTILNSSFELTGLGKKLSHFPLEPAMGRILLAANELGCLDEALTIISLLYVESLFHIPPHKQTEADAMLDKFRSNEGDTIMLLKVYKAFKRVFAMSKNNAKTWCMEHFIDVKNLKMARLIRKQLHELCKGLGMTSSSCNQDTAVVRRALTHGLFNNVASMWNGKYRNKMCDEIHIHPNSCLFKTRPECVLYVELIETSKCYMRNCTLIDANWVREV